MRRELSNYIEQYLSPYLCGYRKGYSTRYEVVKIIESWKETLDIYGYAAAVLMYLSKAFDTINHDLLVAKLHAYGFDKNSINIIKSYINYRWQSTKINTSMSSWSELIHGVPQGHY